jgi:hypothetical protein
MSPSVPIDCKAVMLTEVCRHGQRYEVQTMTDKVTLKRREQAPGQTEAERRRERELDDAVARIYQRYGSDLSAFRRDVETELAKREKNHQHA